MESDYLLNGGQTKGLYNSKPQRQDGEVLRSKAIIAAAVASIGAFGLGTVEVWAAVTLKELDEVEHFGPLLDNQKSWIASIAYLGALVAAPSSGYLISSLGRKKSMIALSLPFVLGWLLVAFAQNLTMLYVGRFITGFCGGSFTVSIPAYVSEISGDHQIRGRMGTIMVIMINSGNQFTYVLGAFLSCFWLSIVCAIIPLIFIFSMAFMPESPRYLIMNEKAYEAARAVEWLRGVTSEIPIRQEILEIEESIQRGLVRSSGLADLFSPSVLKPIGISVCLMAFGQFSGVTGVLLYTVQVFEEAGTDLDGKYASIIIGGCQLVTVIIVPFLLVDKLGRKTLLLISEFVLIIGLGALGTFYFLKGGDQIGIMLPEQVTYARWIPLTSLIVIIVGYNAGVGPLPWVISSELLPNHVRELGGSIVNISYWGLSFIAGVTFQGLGNLLNNSGLYWLSAVICIFGFLFIVLIVPETKGKNASEIANLFNGNNKFASDWDTSSEELFNSTNCFSSEETNTKEKNDFVCIIKAA